MKRFIMLLVCCVFFMCVFGGCSSADEAEINIGVLKGPTGIGAIDIMAKSDKNEKSKYHFSLSPDVTDIVARLTNGDLDIGALPTNTAANLYNKANGDVQIIAINCTSVLYILENGNSVTSMNDLKGRTIYVNGQGANPEQMINFCLRSCGLEPGTDVDVRFAETGEISAKMISGDAELCMLPVPAVTTILMKNPSVRKALDMSVEYDKAAGDGSALTMGCLVARKEFIENHADDIDLFLERYKNSIAYVFEHVDEAAGLVAEYEITGNAEIAAAAIPDCGIVCITGSEMKPLLDGYYRVLFDTSPDTLGGSIPGDDFYYGK